MIFLTDLTFGIVSVDLIGREPSWGLAAPGEAAWNFQNGVLQAPESLVTRCCKDQIVCSRTRYIDIIYTYI